MMTLKAKVRVLQERRRCLAPIEQWTRAERAELAVPEHDPDYLPEGMQPPDAWYSASGEYLGATIVDVQTKCGPATSALLTPCV